MADAGSPLTVDQIGRIELKLTVLKKSLQPGSEFDDRGFTEAILHVKGFCQGLNSELITV
jgi:hypothetical protein